MELLPVTFLADQAEERSKRSYKKGNFCFIVAAQRFDGVWLNWEIWLSLQEGKASITHDEENVARGEPIVCAFDIETTKLPLQFPNPEIDEVWRMGSQLLLQTALHAWQGPITVV